MIVESRVPLLYLEAEYRPLYAFHECFKCCNLRRISMGV